MSVLVQVTPDSPLWQSIGPAQSLIVLTVLYFVATGLLFAQSLA